MRQKLGEMLIEAGAIDQAQLKAALADQRRWGRPLGKTLVELRLIREEELVRVLARQLGLQGVDLDKVNIPDTVIQLVPAHLAKQHMVVPFDMKMKFLDVAMLDPTNLGVIDEIRIRTQLNVRPYLAGPKMLERAIERYYTASTRVSAEFEIPIVAEVPQQTERDTVSVTSTEVRDGLRTYRSATTGPQQRLEDPQQPRATTSGSNRRLDSELGHSGTRSPTRSGYTEPPPSISIPFDDNRDREIDALQERISTLEALVQRDEQVLRKLLSLLIEKGIATRDEIVERLG